MRKELLLEKKKDVVDKFNKYSYQEHSRFHNNEDLLKQFSLRQLEIIVEMLNEINEREYMEVAFYPLSVNECVHRDTGKIIYVDRDGVSERTEEKIMRGAASNAYKKYVQFREELKQKPNDNND